MPFFDEFPSPFAGLGGEVATGVEPAGWLKISHRSLPKETGGNRGRTLSH